VFDQKVAKAGDKRLYMERSNTWPVQSINSKNVVSNMWYYIYHKRILQVRNYQLFIKPQMNLTYREVMMF